MKHYTIGQIYRLGLLKNFEGRPYKHKATVSQVVNKLKFKIIKTQWGLAKVITEKQIREYNKK